MTTHTQAEAKSTSTPIPAMQPAHSGLLPQQEQEELERSLLPAEDWRRSPDSPNPIPINPSLVGHRFGSVAIGPTTSPMLQRKLAIGQPNDQYEQEADRVADQVMRMPEPKIQRLCPECEEELQRQPMEEEEKKKEEETLQTKPMAESITPLIQRQTEPTEEEKKEEEETLQTKPLAGAINHLIQRQTEPMEEEKKKEEETLQTKTASGEASIISPALQNQITALQVGGHPLPESERHFFEPRFGTDFSQVRIHAGGQAAEAARSVNARAFTLGRDVVFGAGQYQPRSTDGQRLLAHELTHVIQQSGVKVTRHLPSASGKGATANTFIARQAALPLEAPPVETTPLEEVVPETFPVPERGPRYAPSPYDNSFEAALARANIRDYAKRQRMQAERPIATLARGGKSPDFITVEGTRNYSWLGGPGGGSSVTARVRRFHVLDAIEHDVSQATNENHLRAILERHFPVEALLNRGIEISRGRPGTFLPGIQVPFLPWDEPLYDEGFDPRAEVRLKVFQAAVQRRVQVVPALAQSRLIPQTRRRGGCRIEPINPLGDDPLSVLYCHFATKSPYSYKITIESGTGGLTRRWAEIDSLRGNTWFECKCGYEALLSGKARGEGVARSVLEKLDHQVLNHVDIARTCGLEYRYIVSNNKVAETLRNRWFGNVEIWVVPFEGCD